MTTASREIHLIRRPQGLPEAGDFSLVERQLADPGPGEVLVRNEYLSVDPYMRGRMRDVKSYTPPFELGVALEGGAVGTVVAGDGLPVGSTVVHMQGWREYAVGAANRFSVVDPDLAPAPAWLGVLGMPGLTAYVGLMTIGAFTPGQTVFVSGAAGAVGSLVGQLVHLKGGRAIGSAGSPEKAAWLREIGFADAFCYRERSVFQALPELAPDGIDLYFDNVGGEHLEAALSNLKPFGRVAACGAIAQYNDTGLAPGPRGFFQVVGKRLTIRGFIVSDHADQREEFLREVGPWLKAGRIVARETLVDGIEQTVDAFLGLFDGNNTGKMLVRL